MAMLAEAKGEPRALLVASPTSQSEDTRQHVIEWLKITALPLVLFLIGACLWGCIKHSTAWKMLTKEDERTTPPVRVEGPRCNSTQDLEAPLEAGQVRLGAAHAHVDGPVGETTSDLETSTVPENDASRVNEDSSK